MESLFLAITQNLSGHSPDQLAVVDMALSRRVGVGDLEKSLQLFCDFHEKFQEGHNSKCGNWNETKTGVQRQNTFVCFFWQPNLLLLFLPAFLQLGKRGHNSATASSSWLFLLSAINIKSVYGFIVCCDISPPLWQQRWGVGYSSIFP